MKVLRSENLNYKFRIAAYIAFFFCFFSYGVFAQMKNLWPYNYFADAIEYYDATRIKKSMIKSVKANAELPKSLSTPVLLSKARVDIIDGTAMSPGLTLLCMGKDACAMIDAFGQVRQLWSLAFSDIWSKPPHISSPVPDIMTFIHDAEVFPNGDLLAVYHSEGDTPYGYGLVKMDRKSKIIWKIPMNMHHDVYVSDSGKIYTLSQKYFDNDFPQLKDIYKSHILKDMIEIVSPDGEELDSIPIIDAFMDTPYEQMLYQTFEDHYHKLGDYTHANSVMPLEERMADKFPMFKPGQILVSLRNSSIIAVIDPETRKVVWAAEGIWTMQHEASFQPNGHILMMDNQGYFDGSGDATEENEDHNSDSKSSRLLEIDPATGGIAWFFTATPDESFYTRFRGTVRKLPNGNYLATETAPGNKMLEITPDKEVVWRYTNNNHKEKVRTNNMFIGSRVPFEFFDQDFLNSI